MLGSLSRAFSKPLKQCGLSGLPAFGRHHSSDIYDREWIQQNYGHMGSFLPRISGTAHVLKPASLRRHHFKKTFLLGFGRQARVYAGVMQRPSRIPGSPYAVALKRFTVSPFYISTKVEADCEILSHLALSDQENVTTLYGSFRYLNRVYLAMEKLNGESLLQILPGYFRGMPYGFVLRVMLKISRTVKKMHERGIVHRDLNPSNVLLVERHNGNLDSVDIKLIDFGSADLFRKGRPTEGLQGSVAGLIDYMCPMYHQKLPHDLTKADVYSLGVLMYELLCGQRPFQVEPGVDDRYHTLLLEKKQKGPLFEEQMWEVLDRDILVLVAKMLEPDDSKRISSRKVVKILEMLQRSGEDEK